MRPMLKRWSALAGSLELFELIEADLAFALEHEVVERADDFYVSLVGELFERLDSEGATAEDWKLLGDAFASARTLLRRSRFWTQRLDADLRIMSACSYYVGGFPASAYVILRGQSTQSLEDSDAAAVELLTKSGQPNSGVVRELLAAVRAGDQDAIARVDGHADEMVAAARESDPVSWASASLLRALVGRFRRNNLLAVLPADATGWAPLVESFLDRRPPIWEFFPSQVEAIEAGLLTSNLTFSLQMPTGAGKTALSEATIFAHLKEDSARLAVLLVPFRSLAAELKNSVGRQLTNLGLVTRSLYGGSVPTHEELNELEAARVLIATPEAFIGLLAADPTVFPRVTLLMCDEGHLLDSGSRGVTLELLLSRFRARATPPRFVFISAIVPNIEEVNAWLGGSNQSVVRSDYRPTNLDLATLSVVGTGVSAAIGLEINPHDLDRRVSLNDFVSSESVRYLNPASGRQRSYSMNSIKARAVAAARRLLPIGAVAIYCANKSGDGGAIGVAEELVNQLQLFPGPPRNRATQSRLEEVSDHFAREYGTGWIGTESLAKGVGLHHGDLPQDTREIVEGLVRAGSVTCVVCTSTLSEGVNLPIRSLILYSVSRREGEGRASPLARRDIKNLIGRAGRAGAVNKALIVVANPNETNAVVDVVNDASIEPLSGALIDLARLVERWVADGNTLTNEVLEGSPLLFDLVDGIDSTLVELAAEQVGTDALVEAARAVIANTLAARTSESGPLASLDQVVNLRSQKIAELQVSGRLGWVRDSGAMVRQLSNAERLLAIARNLDPALPPDDPRIIDAVLEWFWDSPQARSARRPLPSSLSIQNVSALTVSWLRGQTYEEMARAAGLDVNVALRVASGLMGYVFQSAIEQCVALIKPMYEDEPNVLPVGLARLPDSLRYGSTSRSVQDLLESGVRMRRVAATLVRIGGDLSVGGDPRAFYLVVMIENEALVRAEHGDFAYDRTLADLS